MWLTAVILGLAGGLHCAGMCSPLMMAVSNVSPHVIFTRAIYNAGRIFTYGILGSLVSGFGMLLPLGQYQNVLSIFLGVILVSIALLQVNIKLASKYARLVSPIIQFIKDRFAYFLKSKSYTSIAFLGMINGLLPCGISMLALSYCVLLRGPLDGFNFMIMFGVGTLPVMFGLASLVTGIMRRSAISFQRVTVVLVALSGVMLIVRVFLHAGVEASKHGKDFVEVVLCR